MTRELLLDDIETSYKYLVTAYEPTMHDVDVFLSKCGFYNEFYSFNFEVDYMAKDIYRRFYQ